MKNQNDMIISIVAIVLGIIGFCIGFFTKRQVNAPPSAEAVVLTPPVLQGADVKMANALPSGSNGSLFSTAGASGRGGGAQGGGGGGGFGFGGRGGQGGGQTGGTVSGGEPPPTIAGAAGGAGK